MKFALAIRNHGTRNNRENYRFMNAKSFVKQIILTASLIALNVGPVGLAHADYPQTQTTIVNATWRLVDSTHYAVTAIVYPHNAGPIRAQFTASGRWGVEGQYQGRRTDGGLIFGAIIFAHPGNPLQSRSLVNNRPDDYSAINVLP